MVSTGNTVTNAERMERRVKLPRLQRRQLDGGDNPRHSGGIPLVVSAVFCAVGMAFLLGWGPLVDHHAQWVTGGDLWGIFRAAHYVGWGFFGGVYSPSTGVNTFPGMSLLLAPLAIAAGALGLSESAPGMFLPHPDAVLLLQPVELLMGCTVLFASNSVALRMGVRTNLRGWLVASVAIVVWPVAAIWGHAEDLLAVSFALYAIRGLIDGNYRRIGWLMGVGISLQPLVGLVLPIVWAAVPAGRRAKVFFQAVIPSALLIGLALAGNWSDTYRALVKQPTPPSLNHATPWAVLAPGVGNQSSAKSEHIVQIAQLHHHFHTFSTTVDAHAFVLISGGPVRTISLIFAVLIGSIVWRMRPSMPGILWWCGVALALRCYFEPVMTPYYLAPPLIVALIAAAGKSRMHFGIAAVVGIAVTVFAYYRFSPWLWWLPLISMLSIVLACGYPGRMHLSADGASFNANVKTPTVTPAVGTLNRERQP